MSVFAVQCFTGEELKVVEKLKYVLEKRPHPLVKAVHAFKTYTQKFRGEDTARKEFKSAVPGYIFVELNNGYHTLPAELWHLIKSIPKVAHIFRDKIPEEELDLFFETVDTEFELEVGFSQKMQTREEIQQENKKRLHEANMSGKEPKLDDGKTVTDQINEIKEEVKEDSALRRMIKHCKGFIQRKKETFIFPFSLFYKTRDRIDPFKQMSNKELTNGDYIIPELIKTLKAEVKNE